MHCLQYFNSTEQYQKTFVIQPKERFKYSKKPYIKYDKFCLDKKENRRFRPSKVNHDANRYYWIKLTTDRYQKNVIFCLFFTYIFSYWEHARSFNQGQFLEPTSHHEGCSNIDTLLNKSCLVMEIDFNIDPHNSNIHTILIILIISIKAYRGYPAKRALSAMCKHGGKGPFGRITSIWV